MKAKTFEASELLINEDGSIFHLHLRPEQLIGEAFAGRGLTLPEDALRIRRVDLLAELDANGLCIRQGDRRKGHEEQDAVSGEHRKRSLISLGGIGKVIDTR